MVNMTGAVLGGMVDQQNKVAEQQARNRALGIEQQNADTSRMGVQNNQLQFGQRLALERMNATLENMRQIKANLQSPADLPRVQNTLTSLAQDIIGLAHLGGFDTQAATNQIAAVMAGTRPSQKPRRTRAWRQALRTQPRLLAQLTSPERSRPRARRTAPQVSVPS
jgi:hypothetical protein